MSNIVVFGGHVLGSGGHVLGVGTGGGGTVATPTFSPVAGTYTSTQNVTITCSTGASSIYFTTDGSTPTFPITGTTTLYTGPVSVASSDTMKAIGVATGLTNSAVGTAVYVINSGSTIPNVTALPSTFPGPDVAGFTALNIQSQAAGFQWAETVTGVPVTKITASGTPGAGFYASWYSEMGRAISQAWGPNLDQYHIAFMNVNSTTGEAAFVCDFGLAGSATPGPYNYRSLPSALNDYSSGCASFSMRAGNPHIMYILASGAKLRLYNVVSGTFVDSSAAALGYSASWPSTGWPWATAIDEWMMVNAAETWVTANNGFGAANTAFALNLLTGATQTLSQSQDDWYCAYTDYSMGDGQSFIWDLNANTRINYSQTLTTGNGWAANQASSHVATSRKFWSTYNTVGSDTVPMPAATITQDGTATVVIGSSSVLPFAKRYQGQYHSSGKWWLQPDGFNQFILQSNITPATGPASEQYAISFVNLGTGTIFRLGFAYSNLVTVPNSGGNNYWSQPHGQISFDGKLAIFGSEMLNATRIDLFAIETPLTSGTPPSFP